MSKLVHVICVKLNKPLYMFVWFIHLNLDVPRFFLKVCGGPSHQFGRCPPLQTQQVECPILVPLLGQVCPQGPLWAPALDQTHHQALFTA